MDLQLACLCVLSDACLPLLSAAVSMCTNSIKSNCDVFRQLLTPVVQVGKAISLTIRFTAVDTQKQSQRVEAGEQAGSGFVKWPGHWCFLLCIRCRYKQPRFIFEGTEAHKSI